MNCIPSSRILPILLCLAVHPLLLPAREGANAVQGRDPVQAHAASNDERTQLRLRAEQDDLEAQTLLAGMCERGDGGSADINEARLWYRKAAEQGSPVAQTALGRMIAKGVGTEKDPASAAIWYRRAALQGYSRAQGLLGLVLMKGEGVPVDNVSALMWFTLGSAGDESMDVYWSRKTILARMSKEQVAEAKRKALEFVPQKEIPKVVATPAILESNPESAKQNP